MDTVRTRASRTPARCTRCPHRSPIRARGPTSTYEGAIASAASCTSTSMPPDLHGRGSRQGHRADGGSESRISLSIGARLMAPALVTVILLQFIGIWNNFLLPFVMLNNDQLLPL